MYSKMLISPKTTGGIRLEEERTQENRSSEGIARLERRAVSGVAKTLNQPEPVAVHVLYICENYLAYLPPTHSV
jgi:hypothetical protein